MCQIVRTYTGPIPVLLEEIWAGLRFGTMTAEEAAVRHAELEKQSAEMHGKWSWFHNMAFNPASGAIPLSAMVWKYKSKQPFVTVEGAD